VESPVFGHGNQAHISAGSTYRDARGTHGRSVDDAVQEALAEWAEHETDLAELCVTLDAAEASMPHGEGIEITEASMRVLAEDVNRRGRERRAAKSRSQ
jgi:alpha-D-ribose 1-methylphosphonate 5-triphosphate diphosphatase PhnM